MLSAGNFKYNLLWLLHSSPPRYYLNIFEDNNENLIKEGKEHLQSYIEGKLKMIDEDLSLKPHIIGIRSGHTNVEWHELEKLKL